MRGIGLRAIAALCEQAADIADAVLLDGSSALPNLLVILLHDAVREFVDLGHIAAMADKEP